MPSVPDVAEGRFTSILVQLLWFLGGPFPRSPAVDEAVVRLLVVLSMAYVAGVIVKHFACVLLLSPHLAAPKPAPASATAASSVYPGRFVGPLFTLVSAWFLVFAAMLAAFSFLGDGMLGIGLGFSLNALV